MPTSSSVPPSPTISVQSTSFHPDSPFSRTPIEVVQKIFSLSISSHLYLTREEAKERYHTLKNLSLVSSTARALALPMLFAHAYFTVETGGNIRKLLSTLERNQERWKLIKRLELRFDQDDGDDIRLLLEREGESLAAILERCDQLKGLVLDNLSGVRLLPSLLNIISESLEVLIFKDAIFDNDPFPGVFPRLREMILYDTSFHTRLDDNDLEIEVDRFPALTTLVYFNYFLTTRKGGKQFQNLQHLALMHKQFMPQFTSLDPALTTVHFCPSDYTAPGVRARRWNEIVDGSEEDFRFCAAQMPGDVKVVLGEEGENSLLEALVSRSSLRTFTLPSSWVANEEWRARRGELERTCREENVDLAFEAQSCTGVEYFLGREWWKVPQKDEP